MFQFNPGSCAEPTPFDQLAFRIYRQVNGHVAQSMRRTVIQRLSYESSDDWDRLLEQFDREEGVRLRRLGDDVAHLYWTNHHPS